MKFNFTKKYFSCTKACRFLENGATTQSISLRGTVAEAEKVIKYIREILIRKIRVGHWPVYDASSNNRKSLSAIHQAA